MLTTLKPFRKFAMLAAVGLLAACADGANLGEQRAELGDFQLCYNVVTTNDTVKGPLSREVDLDELANSIRGEVARRFGRYQGGRLYHIAVHVDAYVLAVAGVPVIASPRSALIISVNVWDDILGRPLNDEPEQMTVLESLSGSSVIGSGLTQSAEEQMQTLSQNAAIRIENWLAEHPEWFEHGAAAGDADQPVTPEALAQRTSSEDRCAAANVAFATPTAAPTAAPAAAPTAAPIEPVAEPPAAAADES